MENFKRTALLNGLGIVGVLGGAIVLIAMGILGPVSLIFAAIACYPMAKLLYHFIRAERHDAIRILNRTLPKIGYAISNTEWDEQHTAVQYYGKFLGDNFMIAAAKGSAYIMIYDMTWHQVKVSDPIVPRLMEAVNEVNADSSNTCVVVSEPDEQGTRMIYTSCKTILPTYCTDSYLNSLLRDILNRKPALGEAMRKERPYMQQRRGPVGFAAQQTQTQTQEESTMAPAAQNDSTPKN